MEELKPADHAHQTWVMLRPAMLVGLASGLTFGLLTRFITETDRFGPVFAVMTLSFLFLVPLVIGYLTVRPNPQPSWAYRLLAPWSPTVLSVVVCFAVGWEGTICIVMGLPILLIFSSLGGVLGGLASLRGPAGVVSAMLLPFVAAPLEHRLPNPERLHEVHTSIPIRASPATVWAQIIEVPAITPAEQRPALFIRLGFPRPISATLSRPGVGALRHARFERGVLFLETVTDWVPKRLLRFTIAAPTASIPASTLDRHVTIGGPYFDVLSGRYDIRPTNNGQVILDLTSELRVSTHFNLYAAPWADAIMRSIQENILEVIRARAERQSSYSKVHPQRLSHPDGGPHAHFLPFPFPRPFLSPSETSRRASPRRASGRDEPAQPGCGQCRYGNLGPIHRRGLHGGTT
jgi:hypothetical protein